MPKKKCPACGNDKKPLNTGERVVCSKCGYLLYREAIEKYLK